ncbi:MAG: hypothetical protein Q9174_006258, partial [Haloplaca sp. 1 TL-2023]
MALVAREKMIPTEALALAFLGFWHIRSDSMQARYNNIPQDLLDLPYDELREILMAEIPQMNLTRPPSETTLYILASSFMELSDSVAIRRAQPELVYPLGPRLIPILPFFSSREALSLHLAWHGSMPRQRNINEVVPTQGINSCALDVCLILGRQLRIGLNVCDQMPDTEVDRLDPMTRQMRQFIALPWQKYTARTLNIARDAVLQLLRGTLPPGTPGRGEREMLFFDTPLIPMMDRCR